MARIPDAELERLKAEVPVERLVEASGITLTKTGKDLVGKCPFHEDAEASLIVTPSKNLFHCFGCGTGGGPIDWMMKTHGISFRHAVERLKADHGLSAGPVVPVKGSRVHVLPSPVALDADDQALLRQVVDYYHETLKQSPEALAYLKARGIDDPEAIERFKLGYANRTLGYGLPGKQWKAGGEIRGKLTKLGIYRESGHEHFNGSLVIPVMDGAGNISEVYGRKILSNLRAGTPNHLYLPGPHKGVWNIDAMRDSKEIILCEALFDALTFWCAGFRNVTAAYGVEGFTQDHLEAFAKHDVERVLIAYDRDEAGDRAAEKLAQKLMERGIGCYRIRFSKGMDANEYALKVTPAAKSLGLLVRTAEWMGSAPAPERQAAKEENGSTGYKLSPVEEPKPVSPLAASPKLPADDLPHEIQGQDLFLTLEDRRYRVKGWQKPLSPEVLKVNLMVSRGEYFHIDTLDLYQAKARTAFIRQAGIELGASDEKLKLDLGKVLRKVEGLQADLLAQTLTTQKARPKLTETEQVDALALLKTPDLMRRILQDFEALGVVGEESNKLTGYLAAVSRLLDRPLALLIQSASAAGKSSLMDAVLDLVPEEDLVRYSAMSGQSVFYMGDKGLQHKILAIAEEEGAKQASYALKLLQSEGRVTMASTGKDPQTGMLVTHDYIVEGPVMLFLTTTAIDLDEELLNRCLVLTVNESREQTRAIHTIQRSRETLEGMLAKAKRENLLTLHRNAQRLLEPLAVVNPYADQLSFRDDQTRSRRDHVKYLTLIRSIALLHQFQREIKAFQHVDQLIRYIEVIPSDIELAGDLAREVFSRTVDELLPQTRKLLDLLHAWVTAECERLEMARNDFLFTRKQVREALGWGDSQLKIHLDRLMEMEFLLAHRGRQGQGYQYELLYLGEDAGGHARRLGLIDGKHLRPLPTMATSRGGPSTSRGEDADFSGGSRGDFGPFSGASRGESETCQAAPGEDLSLLELMGDPETHIPPLHPVPSYRRAMAASH
jgi:DNA primase